MVTTPSLLLLRDFRTLIQIMFSSSCFHSHFHFCTAALPPHASNNRVLNASLFISKNKIKVFPLGLFSIRNSNLPNFKVNGNAPVHYLNAALSRVAAVATFKSCFFQRKNTKRLPVMMCIPALRGWCVGLCVKSCAGVITASYGCTCNWLAGCGNEFPPLQQIEL